MTRVITEEQAQALANALQMIVTGDNSEEVSIFLQEPHQALGAWWPSEDDKYNGDWDSLPVKIETGKGWKEQIWRPM